jgi:hypothetical protein
MNFYIETENGQVKNHPAAEENLLHVFGQIPDHWEPFVRVEPPLLGEYETFADPMVTYEKVNGVWTDIFHVVEMTSEEKAEIHQNKVNAYKTFWATLPQRENFTAWVFNETTIEYEPPFPKPDDGKKYFWSGPTNSWVEKPQYPNDGKTYRLDYATGNFIEVTQ